MASESLSGAVSATRRYAHDVFGRKETLADGASRYGYLHDPHGSVSLLVDQAGAVKASYGYSAYGGSNSALTKTAAGFSLAVNAYRYTGKRLDAASNTLDMGARRFSRSSGRFLQVDSYDGALANLSLSLSRLMGNRYALAGGNPVNYIGADGHVVVLDDTGGKPETGYGSGPNSGSPVATPQEPAADPHVSIEKARAAGVGLIGSGSVVTAQGIAAYWMCRAKYAGNLAFYLWSHEACSHFVWSTVALGSSLEALGVAIVVKGSLPSQWDAAKKREERTNSSDGSGSATAPVRRAGSVKLPAGKKSKPRTDPRLVA